MLSRRTIFKWLVNGVGIVVTAAIAVPAAISVFSPVSRARERQRAMWRRLGPLDRFPEGDVSEAALDPPLSRGAGERVPRRSVYVWRADADGEVVVFSRACTDLGCPIHYDRGSAFFYCPCHGGIFRKNGEPVAGPPARPLFRYRTRVRDGELEIDVASVPPMA